MKHNYLDCHIHTQKVKIGVWRLIGILLIYLISQLTTYLHKEQAQYEVVIKKYLKIMKYSSTKKTINTLKHVLEQGFKDNSNEN